MVTALLAGSITTWATSRSQLPQTDGRAALSQEATATSAPQPPVGVSPDRVIPARAADLAALKATAVTAGVPTRLTINRLGISMRIIPVGVDGTNAMSIPQDPKVAGWYRFGARPSDASGATVIAGHIDTAAAGTGPLSRITSARQGDQIILGSGAASTQYTVESVSRIPKSQLDLAKVFNRDSSPRLHLLTCGGRFDKATGHYEDNILVVARIANR
ncbi:class F sortase [Dermatophilaceae bacterium Sec6.4]|nr:class F sortase [Actinomycetota bacterium]